MASPEKERSWTQFCAYRKTKAYSSWREQFKCNESFSRGGKDVTIEIPKINNLNDIILDPPEHARWRFDKVSPENIDKNPSRGIPIQIDVMGLPIKGTEIIAYYEFLPNWEKLTHMRCDIYRFSPSSSGGAFGRKMIHYHMNARLHLKSGAIDSGISFQTESEDNLGELQNQAKKSFMDLCELIKQHGTASLLTFGMMDEKSGRDR